jgi:ATP-dependent exoDNAse (exonuclease V) beta subunit
MEGLDYNTTDARVGIDLELLKQHAKNARKYIADHFGQARQMFSELPFEAWVPGESGAHGVWTRGTIDLLIEDEKGSWHIVDFKTADVAEASMQGYSLERGYHKQLSN